MKVVQISEGIRKNSSPYRIGIGIKRNGVESKLLVVHSDIDNSCILIAKKSIGYRILRKITSKLEKAEFDLNYKKQENMPFSYYNVGIDISKEKIVREADVLFLHWICGSYISPRGIKRLLKLGKPVVWICHDNWPFTGGCHVRLGCDKYKEGCGCCPQLMSKKKRDWSYRLMRAKKKAIKSGNLTVISPSSWMDNNVKESYLFSGIPHGIIPNPIDSQIFKPMDKAAIRKKLGIDEKKTILLFGAINASTTPYKGYDYLLKALDLLERDLPPEIDIEAVVFGAKHGEERQNSRIKIHYLGFLNEEQMAEAYNCADIYVVPSLEDSFNNTVVESFACETPVVAFATGGITDIINHKINGYLAEYKNAEDLAQGVKWLLEGDNRAVSGKNGREKVLTTYDTTVIGKKYVELCKGLLQ